MLKQEPTELWKVEVNDRYQKFVSAVLSLSTATLVLPALFLREILGVPQQMALIIFLNWKVYLSWGLLCIVIICALAYYYASAKWVKSAWSQPVAISPRKLEFILDSLFLLMVVTFLGGVGFLLSFLATARQ